MSEWRLPRWSLAAILAMLLLATAHGAALDDRRAALADAVSLQLPDGAGPHPLAILMPGCLGWHPHHEQWRTRLLARGYAVVFVDSFSAAGLNSPAVLEREVCSGRKLSGAERAADLMVALADLEARDDLDLSHSIMFGWSHGGWSVLEFLMRTAGDIVPSALDTIPPLPHLQVSAALLFYPYCGPGLIAAEDTYSAATRTLLFHGERDRITAPAACRKRIERLREHGAVAEFISLKGASHWFDNFAAPEAYDAAASALVEGRIEAVLEEIGHSP